MDWTTAGHMQANMQTGASKQQSKNFTSHNFIFSINYSINKDKL